MDHPFLKEMHLAPVVPDGFEGAHLIPVDICIYIQQPSPVDDLDHCALKWMIAPLETGPSCSTSV